MRPAGQADAIGAAAGEASMTVNRRAKVTPEKYRGVGFEPVPWVGDQHFATRNLS